MNEKNSHTLKLWQRRKTRKSYKKLLCKCDLTDLKYLSECTLNIINGNVPCDVHLLPVKSELKISCDSNTSTGKRRKTFCTTKRINLLRQISQPINSYWTQWLLNNLFLYLNRIMSRNNPKGQKFFKIRLLPRNSKFWLFYEETISLN